MVVDKDKGVGLSPTKQLSRGLALAFVALMLTSCGTGRKTYAENEGLPEETSDDTKATSFLRQCKLSPEGSETAKTMAALQKALNLTDCAEMRAELNRRESLDLSGTDIQDVSFLAFFPHFETVDISGNRVKDVRSLMGFNRLVRLDISENPISDISMLKELTEVEDFAADGTLVSGAKTADNCPAEAKSAAIAKFCKTTTAIRDNAVSMIAIPRPVAGGAFTIEFAKTADFAEIAFKVDAQATRKRRRGRRQSKTYYHKAQRNGQYFYRIVDSKGQMSDVTEVQLVDYNGDLDKDGIINGYEMNPVGRMNLKKDGADFRRKDVFVEMGYMKESYLPTAESLEVIKKAFADAPVKNPDGSKGINIHLKMGQMVPYDDDLKPYRSEFSALKKRYFKNRGDVYHYMIWVNRYNSGGSSGVSMGIPGKDFIVSLGSWGRRNTERAKIGTFMHELGHNLGLKHGGADHMNYKPNYISIMNYAFQVSGLWRDGKRVYDYQRLPATRLDENALDESVGLGSAAVELRYGTQYNCNGRRRTIETLQNGGIDWNCDGKIGGIVKADINNDGKMSRLVSEDNWQAIDLRGGITSRGFIAENMAEEHEQELTLEMQRTLEGRP